MRRNPKILLVEDMPVVQMVHGDYLQRLGYRFDLAKNGKQAISFYDKNHYDAVLLDKGLPDMDGTEICKVMRKYDRSKHQFPTPIIALTSDDSTKQECLTAGCNAFATKPIEQEALGSLVTFWVNKSKKTVGRHCFVFTDETNLRGSKDSADLNQTDRRDDHYRPRVKVEPKNYHLPH